MTEMSLAQARRIALHAQGLDRPPPERRTDSRHINAAVARMGLLQLDSVNVVVRSHYLPVFARVGTYRRDLLDGESTPPGISLYEYWGHAASLLPVELYPAFRYRMEAWAKASAASERVASWKRPEYIEAVFTEVAARGPIASRDLTQGGPRKGPWWDLPDGKLALEHLFAVGRVTAAGRRNFERLYDIPERVIPAAHLNAPALSPDEAHRELTARGIRSLGIGTIKDVSDYYRIPVAPARAHLRELAAEGVVDEVSVEGWKGPVYLDAAAGMPRRATGRALLSPFDPMVWERSRTERLFGFHYRIEIYVPGPKRIYGYYVLPFLLGDSLVARVDVKADRQRGVLVVPGAYAEAGADLSRVAAALGPELDRLAAWLVLGSVEVGERGDLTAPLRRGWARSTGS